MRAQVRILSSKCRSTPLTLPVPTCVCACGCVCPYSCREKNLEKAIKEAKVKARRSVGRSKRQHHPVLTVTACSGRCLVMACAVCDHLLPYGATAEVSFPTFLSSAACREAARATMLADTVSDNDLAAVEDAFFKAAGLTEGQQGLQFLAKRLAAGRVEAEPEPAAEQALSGKQLQGGSMNGQNS